MDGISELLFPVANSASIRAIETASFSVEGASYPMMERAAQALFDQVCRRFQSVQKYTVLCGGGNNGGDGALLAALLFDHGMTVQVYDVASKARNGDAQKAWEVLLASGVDVRPSSELDGSADAAGVIVDAILGIGGREELQGEILRLCCWANRSRVSGARVLSVDAPTGLNVDSGQADLNAIIADVTVTFIEDKQGFYLRKGLVCAGSVICEKLNSVSIESPKLSFRFESSSIGKLSPCARYPVSHKGSYGHISVIGGDYGYGGAIIMAASGAARAGAGTVSVMTRERHIAPLLARSPSVMAVSSEDMPLTNALRNDDSILLVGPGLGREPWGEALFRQAMMLSCRKVIDADALYWLSVTPTLELQGNAVLTPHVGEAARLLELSVDDVSANLVNSAKSLSRRYSAVVVLKDVSSIIAAPDGRVVITGNPCPGLAKGGSGDVLSGMIASCLAYYSKPFEATVIAVAWHNYAAIRAGRALGDICMQPYELLEYLQV
ncbi:NAD(P)H-hydrate dehydratase [Marinomonas balearica]|uniref:Bifunctional NAD(P)H-hydrate repair enzyme n=1 Tax=Marinomonas balearica TaxID=491947 RepID=A0A4R6MBM7_9GAMM|nr:NAD(P)H-hydrate dehydratase [Marinomonas balearica]TDO99017.1 NAD(P)H-hydrate epimerase [Marinomonas balearica]